MEQTLEHRIRERAYEIWHAEGCAEGKSHDHWLTAERELLSAAAADLFASSEPTAAPKGKNKSTRAARRATKAATSSAAA
jgi:hypothetical protein